MADTEVLTGSADESGVFSEKAIQDVQVGDLVWTRADGDPSAPLELRPVLAVEEHVVYDLQTLSVEDETGNVEELHVTDAHPFYVDGVGWRAAVTLEVGMRLVSADGHELTVVANVDELRPEGVTVYNFTVESGHSYYVEDGLGDACWIWVHNKVCAGANHWWPVAFGNEIPRGNRTLTPLTELEHTDFHDALNAFLRTKTKTLNAGKSVDMMPRKGNAGELVRRRFSLNERATAFHEFFSTYNGGAHYDQFLDEMMEAMKRGLLR